MKKHARLKNSDQINTNECLEYYSPIDIDQLRPPGFHSQVQESLAAINSSVTNKSGWVARNFCPACGSKSYRNWMEVAGNCLVECNVCSTGFSTRHPANFSDAYETDEHLDKSIHAYDKTRDYRINRFGTERINLISKFKSEGRLLDVGCGTGWFLEAARTIFDVQGYEPTKNLAEFTRKKLGLNIHTDFSLLEPNSFDVITVFDVIEHVPDPTSLLSTLHSFLAPSGILVVFTPNKDSAAFMYMKKNQNLIFPPLHLSYFNIQAFDYLKSDKFSILYSRTFGIDIGDMFSYERDRGNMPFSDFLYKNCDVLQTFLDNTSLSNHLRVVLQRF